MVYLSTCSNRVRRKETSLTNALTTTPVLSASLNQVTCCTGTGGLMNVDVGVTGNVFVQVFHAPSFGDEDFELATSSTAAAASDGAQQTARTMERLRSVNDDDKSPTSPDTGCWSSPDGSRSPPPCDVDQRRQLVAGFQHVARPDDADVCLLKLPPPDEFHVPDIRYAGFYRCAQHQQHLPGPVAYNIPPPLPPPPRYPPGYGAVMRSPRGSSESCALLDALPLRCDRAVYSASSTATEYASPGAGGGGGLCYNGTAGVNSPPTADMLLRPDTVRRLQSPFQYLLYTSYRRQSCGLEEPSHIKRVTTL